MENFLLCSVTRSKKYCLLKYEKNKVDLLKYAMFGIILGYIMIWFSLNTTRSGI